MKNNIIITCYTCFLFLFSSCDSFLEEYSQDLTYAKTAADLDEILIGDGYMKVSTDLISLGNSDGYYFPWLHVMDDDIAQISTGWSADGSVFTNFADFYLWSEYPYMREGKEVDDVDWKRLYKHINSLNVILSKTGEINNDLPREIDRIKGECYFLRGVYYFYLVNLYAKPYAKATASTDLGVPVKTTEYVEDIYFKRNTMEETYARITEDLTEAARLLKGKKHKTVYRAGFHAAHAFLSRVYLYMEQYDKSIASADSVLQGNYSLLDYNERFALVQPDSWGTINEGVSVTYKDSPETIFSQGGNCFENSLSDMTDMSNFNVSDDLVAMFSKELGNDLRFGSWLGIYKDPWNAVYKVRKLVDDKDGMVSSECLLRLSEVFLNKAEALAMLSREDEAMNLIEELRVKRMKQGSYTPLDKRTGEKLVQLVRDERRRELCFEGHRWFDLRRYAVNSVYPYTKQIIHDYYFYNNTTGTREYLGSYRLNEYGEEPAYVIPIPRSVIEFNKGNMVDNATRPQREMFKRF